MGWDMDLIARDMCGCLCVCVCLYMNERVHARLCVYIYLVVFGEEE